VTHTLETARLRLVPLAPEHADALHEIYGDPAVRRFLISRPESRADFDGIFARALECGRTLGMWAILPRGGDRLLGRCGFYSFSERARPELAILLASEAWGRGLATEAARACLRFAFDERGVAEVVAVVRPGNAPALGLLRRLGMSPEATIEIGGEPAAFHRIDAEGFARGSGTRSRIPVSQGSSGQDGPFVP
jgi:ribosomal-protein-alanine N-acetyltransferase